MKFIRDDIDFDKYLEVEDKARVRPASEWLQEVIDRYYNPQGDISCRLPWLKTFDKARLRPGEFSVWAGVNGHGKSLILSQVVIGLMAQGQKVCIASMEMHPRATLYRMARQAIGVAEPTLDFLRRFHHWTDGRLWLYDQQDNVPAKRVVGLARYCVGELGIDHLIVDSLMKCSIAVDDYNGQKWFADALSNVARDTGLGIHLVAHSRKRSSDALSMGKFDVKGAGETTDMADNCFIVRRNKAKEAAEPHEPRDRSHEPDTYLTCDKQRHGEWEGAFGLWFDKRSMQFLESEGAHVSPMIEDFRTGGSNGHE